VGFRPFDRKRSTVIASDPPDPPRFRTVNWSLRNRIRLHYPPTRYYFARGRVFRTNRTLFAPSQLFPFPVRIKFVFQKTKKKSRRAFSRFVGGLLRRICNNPVGRAFGDDVQTRSFGDFFRISPNARPTGLLDIRRSITTHEVRKSPRLRLSFSEIKTKFEPKTEKLRWREKGTIRAENSSACEIKSSRGIPSCEMRCSPLFWLS
jgi:hypothetical protein